MPRGDGTGPRGMGPMTGRGMGYCAEYAIPGFMNQMPGRGMGRGRGMGFGRGRGMGWGRGWGYPVAGYPAPYDAPVTPLDEPAALKEQAKYLTESLDSINRRLAELEKGKK